jgi:chitin synthase
VYSQCSYLPSKRYSLISSETPYQSASLHSPLDSADFSGPIRQRYDSTPLLTLPAPLAVSSTGSPGTSVSHLSRSSEDQSNDSEGTQRLIASPGGYESPHHSDSESLHRADRRRMSTPIEARMRSTPGAVYRQSTTPVPYPGETQNPYGYSQGQVGGYGDVAFSAEPEEYQGITSHQQQSRSRGVSLVDSGPVPTGDGVRRLSRPGGRRPTSQATSQMQSNMNRYSQVGMPVQQAAPSSYQPQGYQTQGYQAQPYTQPGSPILPPGAAPPRPQSFHGH